MPQQTLGELVPIGSSGLEMGISEGLHSLQAGPQSAAAGKAAG